MVADSDKGWSKKQEYSVTLTKWHYVCGKTVNIDIFCPTFVDGTLYDVFINTEWLKLGQDRWIRFM